MEIDGLTSAFFNQINNTQTDLATSRMQSLSKTGLSNATDDELMDACKEFEAYLLEQVMKRMQETTSLFSDEEDNSNSAMVDYFMDSTIQELAGDVTDKQGLGIAQTLYDAMKRQYSI